MKIEYYHNKSLKYLFQLIIYNIVIFIEGLNNSITTNL